MTTKKMMTTVTRTKRRLARTLPLASVALTLAVVGSPGCGDLRENTAPIDYISYTPDGSLVLLSPSSIYVYDGRVQTELRRISLDALPRPQVSGEYTYSLAADGTVAAVVYAPNPQSEAGGQSGKGGLYGLSDGTLISTFDVDDVSTVGKSGTITDIALSPDKSRLYVAKPGLDGVAKMVDTSDGHVLWSGTNAWRLPVWSPDGETVFGVFLNFAGGNERDTLDAFDGRTGALKWATQPDTSIGGLALVGNGTSLTAPTVKGCVDLPCPPLMQYWSSVDGSPTMARFEDPNSFLAGANPRGFAGFACNATDTCAFRLNLNGDLFIHVYKTDGTSLLLLPFGGEGQASNMGSMAISPDGKLIAVAATPNTRGGVNVYSIEDGSLVGNVDIPFDTY
jgi:WD40 repeat protein